MPPENGYSVSLAQKCHTPYYRPQTKFAKVMFSQVSVSPHRGVSATSPSSWEDTSLGRHPPGQKPPAQCMLGYTPPCPVHAGIHPPPAQCMLGCTPSPLSSAGIRSTSGRYASHWNTFLFSNGVSFFRYGQLSFPVMHKVGSVDIFVLLKLENKMDREIRV